MVGFSCYLCREQIEFNLAVFRKLFSYKATPDGVAFLGGTLIKVHKVVNKHHKCMTKIVFIKGDLGNIPLSPQQKVEECLAMTPSFINSFSKRISKSPTSAKASNLSCPSSPVKRFLKLSLSSLQVFTAVLEPYNSVLSMHSLLEHTDDSGSENLSKISGGKTPDQKSSVVFEHLIKSSLVPRTPDQPFLQWIPTKGGRRVDVPRFLGNHYSSLIVSVSELRSTFSPESVEWRSTITRETSNGDRRFPKTLT
ncbi:Tubulin alpha-1 chain [Platanthera zijinensis]|uniref:Tubulin alpha-1 chain n=1 Tax=Platanthera zijinensis TaxID=2320716 RepID=A0AAP0G0H0_9ASPA